MISNVLLRTEWYSFLADIWRQENNVVRSKYGNIVRYVNILSSLSGFPHRKVEAIQHWIRSNVEVEISQRSRRDFHNLIDYVLEGRK
jgi:hypothetical protein